MSRNLIIISILALLAGIIHCTDTSTGPNIIVVTDSTVTLELGEKAIILPDSLTIEFFQFGNEGRCPTNVECFWEGAASMIFKVYTPDSDTITEYIGITGAGDGSQLSLLAHGYRIMMDSLSPYPVNVEDPIDTSAYRATLHIKDTAHISPEIREAKTTNIEPVNIMLDHFNLDSVDINGDTLYVSINYSGGCREHLVDLYMSPDVFAESNPVQANLYLRHYGNNDACRALISKTYSFDISPIAELYQTMYTDTNSIRLNVFDYYEGTSVSVIIIPYDW